MTTPHVQSFVLISMPRGPSNTPPSGYDLAVLDYHLKQMFVITRRSWYIYSTGIAYAVEFKRVDASP